ncbi:hypothetical protein HMSSN139_51990 [Paenibacillus sp. HMSSN-139]|nr:hypothetical protein HMSSN139_51990 [Paenibacillus sp. HMSSN-139]
MSFQLTQRVIKLLCGRIAYERGEAYYRTGKVTFLRIDHGSRVYEAAVSGTGHYHVALQIDQHGDVHAECNCPAFYSYNNYCKHIAAVLLGIHDMLQGGKPPVRPSRSLLHQDEELDLTGDAWSGSLGANQRKQPGDIPSRDIWIARDMMRLFEENAQPPLRTGVRFDQRTPLEAEFTLRPVPYGYRKYLFGLELKIGEKRLYIVKNIRDFSIKSRAASRTASRSISTTTRNVTGFGQKMKRSCRSWRKSSAMSKCTKKAWEVIRPNPTGTPIGCCRCRRFSGTGCCRC